MVSHYLRFSHRNKKALHINILPHHHLIRHTFTVDLVDPTNTNRCRMLLRRYVHVNNISSIFSVIEFGARFMMKKPGKNSIANYYPEFRDKQLKTVYGYVECLWFKFVLKTYTNTFSIQLVRRKAAIGQCRRLMEDP